jgi:hypothetical protein
VRVPRFRIAWVMFAVAIAALNFGVLRACFDSPSPWSGSELLLFGALPMANLLGVGLLIAQQRPKCRPFLLGFETFGAAGLALYVALTIFSIDNSVMSTSCGDVISSYLKPVLDRTEAAVGREQEFLLTSVLGCVAAAMLGWPQLAFALIGGFLSRRFKVRITVAITRR